MLRTAKKKKKKRSDAKSFYSVFEERLTFLLLCVIIYVLAQLFKPCAGVIAWAGLSVVKISVNYIAAALAVRNCGQMTIEDQKQAISGKIVF